MTAPAPYDATPAPYEYSVYIRPFQEGDTVRCGNDPDSCKVLGTWSDWLWLYSLASHSLAPFTAGARDCSLVKEAEVPRWPNW